ncbi:hypothetical protein D3C84_902930 [compost metagenome]
MGLDTAQPLAVQRQHPCQAARDDLGKLQRQRVGATDQIRREQRGDGRYGYRDRVKKVAGDLQGHAQRRDDEGELANLRQPHPYP